MQTVRAGARLKQAPPAGPPADEAEPSLLRDDGFHVAPLV